MPYQYTNTALGAASVFVSILKSIISYLKLSERSENHRICSLQFAQISNEIKMELSLRRNQRQPAKMMLDIVKVKYKNLMEVAQLLDNDVIRRFREKYLSHREASSEISLPPVFSNIPGIKILGADSEHEYMEQMEKNLQRYTAEKQFERDHMESEFKHVVALRAIREKYRISDRGKEEQDLRASRYAPSPSRPRRQNSMGEEPRASSASSSALPSSALSSSALSSSALSTIPEQEPSENLAPTSPV